MNVRTCPSDNGGAIVIQRDGPMAGSAAYAREDAAMFHTNGGGEDGNVSCADKFHSIGTNTANEKAWGSSN